MTDEDRLADLLLQWEENLEQGREVPAEELCKDCPHLIDEMSRRIQAMQATSWMDKPVDSGSDDDGGEIPPGPPPLPLAGRYRLDQFIAEGGFGQVWQGFDLELERKIAVKLSKPSRLGAVEQFVAEARRVARLRHPGIVTVHDVVRQDDACFIVSDYIEGGSLRDRITDSPSSEQSTTWIADVAEALAYAHQQGFVHRDIKPANILIDHHGRALLTDFGIAATAEELSGAPPLSLGTLAYMSPEQAEGKSVDSRSDIYSLGVVLFELLTGRLPYQATEPTKLRREVAAGPAALFSKGDRVSPELRRICEKCLSLVPAERYSADELAAALRELSVPGLKRWKMGAGATALLIVVAVSVMAIQFAQRPPEERPAPVASLPDQRPVALAVFRAGGTVRLAGSIDPISSENDLLDKPVHIRAVDLANCSIDHDLMRLLAETPTITDLALSATNLADNHLTLLRGKMNVRKLRLNDTGITNVGLEHVGTLKNLELLELTGARITDHGLAHLARLKKLTWLAPCRCPITDAGAEHIAHMTSLRELRLNDTRLTDDGIKKLAALKNLQLLELRDVRLTDDGIAALSELTNLTWLDISGTQITDDGFLSWRKPAGLRELRANGISGLTGAGLEGFEKLPKLRRLEISRTNVSAAAVEILRQRLVGGLVLK